MYWQVVEALGTGDQPVDEKVGSCPAFFFTLSSGLRPSRNQAIARPFLPHLANHDDTEPAMAFFSHDQTPGDVHEEIAALRRDLARLGVALSKQGAATLRDTGERTYDFGSELAERTVAALPSLRRRASMLEDSIRENPGRSAAIFGLAALTVAAAVLFSGSSSRR